MSRESFDTFNMDISTWFLSPVWSLNLSLLEFLMSLLESLLLSSVICILLLKTLSKPGPLIDDKLMNGRCHKDRIENQRKCLKKIFRIRNPDHLDLSTVPVTVRILKLSNICIVCRYLSGAEASAAALHDAGCSLGQEFVEC